MSNEVNPVQGPIVEVSISPTCEQTCSAVCGALATVLNPDLMVPVNVFENRVLNPLIDKGLKPPMVTITGGSIGLPAHQKLLRDYMASLGKHGVPISLSTTLYFENDDFWQRMRDEGHDIRRIHTSFRDPDPEISERQGRLRETGERVIKNLFRIQEYLPNVVLQVETLTSKTLAPRLTEIGDILLGCGIGAGEKRQWQLQTLKASGNAASLDEALLGDELSDALRIFEDHNFVKRFGPKGVKLLCMPPVCTKEGAVIQRIMEGSGNRVFTTRCTEGHISTELGTPSGVVYVSPHRTPRGENQLVMRPCFIVDPPEEYTLSDLMRDDAGEAYLHGELFNAWRDNRNVPSNCRSCNLSGSFEAQHTGTCIPNCRASAISLCTSGSMEQDLSDMPTLVERQHRDGFNKRIVRLEAHLWNQAGTRPDGPTEKDQWASSFAYELQQMGKKTRLDEGEMRRIQELEQIAQSQFGFDGVK